LRRNNIKRDGDSSVFELRKDKESSEKQRRKKKRIKMKYRNEKKVWLDNSPEKERNDTNIEIETEGDKTVAG
jgi:hypothetical protein